MKDYSPEERKERLQKARKTLLGFAMISMTMVFAGLTSAYVVRHGEGNWQKFELPWSFYLSTVIILISSISVQMAYKAIKAGDSSKTLKLLWATLILGLGFSYSQFMGWSSLVNEGVFFVGNPSGSFLYVLTGLHLAHLFGGLIYLGYILQRTSSGKVNQENPVGINLCAMYWHFLDGLWIYLFLFLLFIR